MQTRWIFFGASVALFTGVVLPANAGGVSVNGAAIPRASSTIDATQEVTEFRAGGDPTIQLVPGSKRYGVCLETPNPIAVLDAELPVGDSPDRFTIGVEDGRQFSQCLLASLATDGGRRRRLTYCLRCENVTTP